MKWPEHRNGNKEHYQQSVGSSRFTWCSTKRHLFSFRLHLLLSPNQKQCCQWQVAMEFLFCNGKAALTGHVMTNSGSQYQKWESHWESHNYNQYENTALPHSSIISALTHPQQNNCGMTKTKTNKKGTLWKRGLPWKCAPAVYHPIKISILFNCLCVHILNALIYF